MCAQNPCGVGALVAALYRAQIIWMYQTVAVAIPGLHADREVIVFPVLWCWLFVHLHFTNPVQAICRASTDVLFVFCANSGSFETPHNSLSAWHNGDNSTYLSTISWCVKWRTITAYIDRDGTWRLWWQWRCHKQWLLAVTAQRSIFISIVSFILKRCRLWLTAPD